LFELKNEKEAFRVSILGQSFQDPPAIFEEAKIKLCDELLHFGSIDNRSEYLDVLSEADVVVSTALHEFFGVAMIEASVHGCYPLLPERLVAYFSLISATFDGEIMFKACLPGNLPLGESLSYASSAEKEAEDILSEANNGKAIMDQRNGLSKF